MCLVMSVASVSECVGIAVTMVINSCFYGYCRSSSLSSDVTHWHQYQNMVQQLLPWLDSAERHLENGPEKAAIESEAQALYEQHQVGDQSIEMVDA